MVTLCEKQLLVVNRDDFQHIFLFLAKKNKNKKKKKDIQQVVTQTPEMVEETVNNQTDINGKYDVQGAMESFPVHQSVPKHPVTKSPEIAVNIVRRGENKGLIVISQ